MGAKGSPFVPPTAIQGERGETGQRGETGASGADGIGTKGDVGARGERGSDGSSIKGDAGERGIQGFSGTNGQAASIAIGSVTTRAAGSQASVVNAGTSQAAVLNFAIPRGDSGTNGINGTSATVALGTVSTGAAGSSATVTNTGTSSAAVLNFAIPRGETGQAGVNATTTATATTTTDGLMSAADKVKLNGLTQGVTLIRTGSVTVSAILLGGASADYTVTFTGGLTFPTTAYVAMPTKSSASLSLGNLDVSIKTKNLASVVIAVKNNGLATLATGTVIDVVAFQ